MEAQTIREAWLNKAIRHVCVRVFQPAGFDLREDTMKVSCSWPAGRAPDKVIGQCWPRKASASGHNEMFITPVLADPVKVLDVLVHEMVHAFDDCESKHGAAFRKIAEKVGLEGAMKSAHAGETLLGTLREIAADLGPYPHREITLTMKEKKQKTYMLKCVCQTESCGFLFRTTQSMIDKAPDPVMICPACGEQTVEVVA